MNARKALLMAAAALASASAPAQLYLMTDEFDSAATLSNWSRIHVAEGWNADQLEVWNIGTTRTGWMTMIPYTSTWYADYRGVLAFKTVTGDFCVTTRVETSNRAATGAPGRDYSLAGIMVREPRAITNPAVDWAAGGENYVFLSHGTANTPGTYQYEVKTTEDSSSNLEISSAPAAITEIRTVRIGSAFIMLRRPDGAPSWIVHRRYPRADMPATLQVGLTCYTDWPNVSGMDPYTHNSTVNTGANPDLIAQFDYVRYRSVAVPAPYVGLDLTDPLEVSDADLLTFLGDSLDALPVEVSEWSVF